MLSAATPSQSARVPPLDTQKSGSGVMYGNAKPSASTIAYMMRFLVIVSSPKFLEGEMPR